MPKMLNLNKHRLQFLLLHLDLQNARHNLTKRKQEMLHILTLLVRKITYDCICNVQQDCRSK